MWPSVHNGKEMNKEVQCTLNTAIVLIAAAVKVCLINSLNLNKCLTNKEPNKHKTNESLAISSQVVSLAVLVTCDQASLIFFVAVGRYAWYNYLTICLLMLLVQNLDFSLIGQETKKVLRTEPWLVAFVAVWFPVKKILRADECHHDFWWGEQREWVFVSFKCFSSEFCSQNSQRWPNRMHSWNRMPWERCFGSATEQEDAFCKINHIFLGRTVHNYM